MLVIFRLLEKNHFNVDALSGFLSPKRLKLLFKRNLYVLIIAPLWSCLFVGNSVAQQVSNSVMPPIYHLLMDDTSKPGVLLDHNYAKNSGPNKNPMKGWSDGWNRTDQSRDETSVGFQYIPWWRIEPEDDQFDKAAIEDILDDHGTIGRHIIIRVHCDWAGSYEFNGDPNSNNGRSRGCPEWIYTDKGVAHIEGEEQERVVNGVVETFTRSVTDHNDSTYIQEAQELIAKLAEFYKDDPRLYAVQLGFLGYWGEWHTFGSNLNPNPPAGSDYTAEDVDKYNRSYLIKDSSRQAILSATQQHFPDTMLMARYPYEDFFQSVDDVGYHNDFFMPNNGGNEAFENAVNDDERWKQGPIGGEAPPQFRNAPNADIVFTTGRGDEMIEKGHYSTMLLGGTPSDPDQLEGYMTLHRKMGYNYQIDSALFPDLLDKGQQFNISLSVANIGVAPFYYDWTIEFALLNENDQVVKSVEALNYDLRRMMPDSATDINGLITTENVTAGNYKVGVRIIQPGSQETKAQQWPLLARNTYIVFSNDISVVEGAWNNNNALSGGWSILGTLIVK